MTTGQPRRQPDPRAAAWSNAANPTRRPLLRTTITLGVIGVGFLLCLLLVLAVIGSALTVQSVLLAGLFALIPLCIVVPTYLWLDRWEAEPGRLLVMAFLWGAVVAVAVAYILNTLSILLLADSGWTDPLATGAVYVAPVVEETLKGLGVVLIYVLRRREFDGVIDGIVYAGIVGAGFAFTENILYLGEALSAGGPETLSATFVMRGLMSPFAHSLFTACTGIGVGIAVSVQHRGARVIAVLAGWLCAVILHGIWNLSALASIQGFLVAYATFQVPLFLAFVGFIVWLRRREGRLIGQYLSPYADAGWLTHGEVSMLSQLRGRKEARRWAREHGGAAAKRSMTAFQDSASDLALLRWRLAHGTAAADAPQRELDLLAAITEHRHAFVGSPVT
ncbi:MAG: PrsW family intramembrane metalloprotease [Intrasporangium sp.]|uniref:PrsW family intramembrane metalloprotease n=1 Tax=Intrasporangium sp. TaxID=1925024 RepID=UPI0026486F2A|nr:PrsW family intramembrane metalloprotease [Intrasporangium sp.]MDN5797897.1 PrsW family intramembrane metalloprotease [Intrasporangium sp.]